MAESEVTQIFFAKAEESLAGAESEFVNGRYNNCANRCYYACFQAAIAALAREGIAPSASQWGHAFVQAQFAGELVNRRKRYPVGLRDTLNQNLLMRQRADYELRHITEAQALRGLRRTRQFLEAIGGRGG
ncbi:MAG: HEPN domain-containing protein [Dehalococcoidia bacterium]|nr:HEPN domain-containing protein [Dehalococcoidia bacterium]